MKSVKNIIVILIALIIFSFLITSSFTLTTNLKTISYNKFNNLLKSKSKSKSNTYLNYKIQSNSKENEEFLFNKFFDKAIEPEKNITNKLKVLGDHETNIEIEENLNNNSTILKNWLKISSKIFKNPALHPEILYDGENILNIKSDFADFRLNDAYKRNVSPDIEPKEERDFWFRLRKKNIYYSTTNADINILGEIRFSDIEEIITINNSEYGFCFKIRNNKGIEWLLCSNDKKIRNAWVCAIQLLSKKKTIIFVNIIIQIIQI